MDYAKFFGLSHTLYRQTPTPAPPKQKPKPTKTETTEPPPVYQQPPSVPDPQSSKDLTPELEPKDKTPLHQYSSQICSHLSKSEDTSSDQESSGESSKESSFSSDSEVDLADISKLLMIQPLQGPMTHLLHLLLQQHQLLKKQSQIPTPLHLLMTILLNLQMAHGLPLMIFRKSNGQFDSKSFQHG